MGSGCQRWRMVAAPLVADEDWLPVISRRNGGVARVEEVAAMPREVVAWFGAALVMPEFVGHRGERRSREETVWG
uniref:DUF834 domain-containing protein n=1 Tax=Oryza punctata TaxID=4537 RepID=A0A0E0JZG7_ORYPU